MSRRLEVECSEVGLRVRGAWWIQIFNRNVMVSELRPCALNFGTLHR